jgi:hypothetical protein
MKLFGMCSLLALLFSTVPLSANAYDYHSPTRKAKGNRNAKDKTRRDDKGGIREEIPDDFRNRFDRWKTEMLSTDVGRRQWERYATNKDFTLTIVISSDWKYSAGTGEYEWDKDGKLIGATITLGKKLDKGYPDPVYYPVMNSLSAYNGLDEISGDILASTKLMHEFGHVDFTAQTDTDLFQRQNKLMASYNTIFLKNGHNVSDPRLVALQSELGGMPIDIWENREYRSEVSAMRYLMERINRESFYCSVVGRIRRNLSEYARQYQDKFAAISGSNLTECKN